MAIKYSIYLIFYRNYIMDTAYWNRLSPRYAEIDQLDEFEIAESYFRNNLNKNAFTLTAPNFYRTSPLNFNWNTCSNSARIDHHG